MEGKLGSLQPKHTLSPPANLQRPTQKLRRPQQSNLEKPFSWSKCVVDYSFSAIVTRDKLFKLCFYFKHRKSFSTISAKLSFFFLPFIFSCFIPGQNQNNKFWKRYILDAVCPNICYSDIVQQYIARYYIICSQSFINAASVVVNRKGSIKIVFNEVFQTNPRHNIFLCVPT